MSASLECKRWRANLSIRDFECNLPSGASVGFDSASARQKHDTCYTGKRVQR
jgi:hypothetical protein